MAVQQGTQMAQQAGQAVVNQGGGFLWNLIMSPVNALASMTRAGFNGVVSWGIPATLGVGAVFAFAPHLIRPLTELVGRTDLADKLGDKVAEGGPATAALIAGGLGIGLAGGAGMLSGAWESLTGGPNSESEPAQSTGGRIGQAIGTAVTFGSIALVTIGALSNKEIKHDAQASNEVTPPLVPAASSERRLNG